MTDQNQTSPIPKSLFTAILVQFHVWFQPKGECFLEKTEEKSSEVFNFVTDN